MTEPRLSIIVLDGATLNPGDNPWDPVSRLGDLVVHDSTDDADVVGRCQSASIVVTNKVPLSAAVLTALPDLKLIAVTATGYDIIDVDAARGRGVTVCNVPEYGTANVAQFTFALILELCHAVGRHTVSVHDGEWQRRTTWSYWETPQAELDGKTLGIIGYGRIGRRVARIANALGMRVLATRPTQFNVSEDAVEWATPEIIFERCDVVTLHCPLTATNRHMVDDAMLRRMRPGAFLINVSRGGLIDERALADHLRRGTLGGAAVDVVSAEPITASNPLLLAPNCLITPHIAWATLEARRRLIAITASNIEAFLEGRSTNVID